MTRSMTDGEKTNYKSLFPALNVDTALVSGENDPVYNCLAWTLGFTDRWLWPVTYPEKAKASDFDTLYAAHGFSRATAGPVAAWGISLGDMTHGSISGTGHGPRWESKCGALLRIQHGLLELKSVAYGDVRYFYERKQAAALSSEREMVELGHLSSDEVNGLRESVSRVPSGLRRRFEQRYVAWRKTWNRPHISLSSDPAAVRQSAEFLRLTALGDEVFPLVVEKLLTQDAPYALQLYDAMQGSDALRLDSRDLAFLVGGEQLRAAVTAKRWLSR